MRTASAPLLGGSEEHESSDAKLEPGAMCLVCNEQPAEWEAVPCAHTLHCRGCAIGSGVSLAQCPTCQRPIQRMTKIRR